MFFELGSALARRPSARLKRLCPFTIFTNCFGSKVRDSGQSLVPEPPHRIIFVMFFLFLCEILRHYSKIWQIDLNLFLFFCSFLLRIRWLGVWGCFFTSSKNRNDLCFLHSKNQQKNTKKKNKSKSKRYQNTHRFSSSLFSFLYLLIMMYSAAQSKHATIKSRLILPDPKLS